MFLRGGRDQDDDWDDDDDDDEDFGDRGGQYIEEVAEDIIEKAV